MLRAGAIKRLVERVRSSVDRAAPCERLTGAAAQKIVLLCFLKAPGEKYVLERRVSDSVMSRKKQRDDKVIHVVFGPGGGTVERRDAKAADTAAEPQSGREPLTDLFSGTEIARLLDVTPARLRTLDRAGVVSPTGRRKGRRAYTFSDLIALRTAQTLLSQRVRLRDVTRAVSALKRTLPKVTRPLQELRIVSDGQRVVVHTQDGAFEPLALQAEGM